MLTKFHPSKNHRKKRVLTLRNSSGTYSMIANNTFSTPTADLYSGWSKIKCFGRRNRWRISWTNSRLRWLTARPTIKYANLPRFRFNYKKSAKTLLPIRISLQPKKRDLWKILPASTIPRSPSIDRCEMSMFLLMVANQHWKYHKLVWWVRESCEKR